MKSISCTFERKSASLPISLLIAFIGSAIGFSGCAPVDTSDVDLGSPVNDISHPTGTLESGDVRRVAYGALATAKLSERIGKSKPESEYQFIKNRASRFRFTGTSEAFAF